MFDTHCHLNFSEFNKNLDEVINNAKEAGVNYIVIPGTDFESSKRAVEIAEQYEGIYAAVGIHPHHIYQYQKSNIKDQKYKSNIKNDLQRIEKFLDHEKVVAIGEIGIDKHIYQKTKYQDYKIDEDFIELQKEFLKAQIDLAIKYEKNIIFHNREAKNDVLTIVKEKWVKKLENRIVFHCCEPDKELLDFAKEHKIFIGVDGDVTYDKKSFDKAQDKQEFVKKIPLELLVLETDSPFLKPDGTKFPNEPKNLKIIAEFIAKILHKDVEEIKKITTENARRLFQLKK